MDAPKALVEDLLRSLAAGPRDYAEVMEAWRTSCPRLPVWEDAFDAGLLERFRAGDEAKVRLTAAGCAALAGPRT
ncbi:MAG: hypothetical protein KGI57_01950 [Hyphomicrobiales bacterium]|nr:hypothetical protein [Hyphomicrobiales bacterium]MDE2016450.1 hypothetical protein [Hyphomicrobiales bacterium]